MRIILLQFGQVAGEMSLPDGFDYSGMIPQGYGAVGYGGSEPLTSLYVLDGEVRVKPEMPNDGKEYYWDTDALAWRSVALPPPPPPPSLNNIPLSEFRQTDLYKIVVSRIADPYVRLTIDAIVAFLCKNQNDISGIFEELRLLIEANPPKPPTS